MPPRDPPISDPPIRLAVLISGGGTTLQNLVERIVHGKLAAVVSVVVSSQSKAGGIERARRAGLAVQVVSRRSFVSTEAFSHAIFEQCRRAEADLVVLGGFLSLLRIPPDYRGRVLNIHPSLIPAFSGKGWFGQRVHEAVIASGVKVSGCTVHFVDDEYDHGPIVFQRCVPVLDGDAPDALAARVFEMECELYPEAIRLYASGRLRVEGRWVQHLPA